MPEYTMDTDCSKYYTLEHSGKYMPKKYYVQNVENCLWIHNGIII